MSGRARFTLAYANGDILQRKGEKREEREREKGRERFFRAERRRGRTRPEEKSHRVRYTAITPLILSARGSDEIPGPRREDIRRSAGRAHPPTMGRATIYYSRTSWHLTCRLSASLFRFSFCRLVDLPVTLFLSLSLSRCLGSRFLVGGSQPAATSATAEQSASAKLVHHRGDHKTPLIPIDFGSRKPTTSDHNWIICMIRTSIAGSLPTYGNENSMCVYIWMAVKFSCRVNVNLENLEKNLSGQSRDPSYIFWQLHKDHIRWFE